MKTVAIFSNDLSVGGIQKSLCNLLNNIDLNKYKIDLYLMKKSDFFQPNISPEIKIHYLKPHSKILMLLPFCLNKKIYKYEGKTKKYDVAIDFDGYQQITSINVLKSHSTKKVIWIHSNWKEKSKYELKFKILLTLSKSKNKYYDEYIGVSKGVIEPFKKVNNLPDIKYDIIPNIIDTKEIFEKVNEECDLNVDSSKYNFCSVGRVCVQKGFDILLKYIHELTEYRKDFHFYLIGDGPERKKLEKIVENYNLESFVSFLGYQKNPYKYMNLMDGFILTSRYEGQGMVLWEAKALGLEIFTTKNLEQYNEGLKGYEDLLGALKKAKKKKKKYDDLSDYNKNILNKIERLLSKNK